MFFSGGRADVGTIEFALSSGTFDMRIVETEQLRGFTPGGAKLTEVVSAGSHERRSGEGFDAPEVPEARGERIFQVEGDASPQAVTAQPKDHPDKPVGRLHSFPIFSFQPWKAPSKLLGITS